MLINCAQGLYAELRGLLCRILNWKLMSLAIPEVFEHKRVILSSQNACVPVFVIDSDAHSILMVKIKKKER
ncbi:hypothetical protein C2U29_01895 [Aeromonas veronii]|nr:hypothetical protein C2U29_01895 [Aeromonas veronii]